MRIINDLEHNVVVGRPMGIECYNLLMMAYVKDSQHEKADDLF